MTACRASSSCVLGCSVAEVCACANTLGRRGLPHQLRRNSSSVFDPVHDSIKAMTLHVICKGLEFPVVAGREAPQKMV